MKLSRELSCCLGVLIILTCVVATYFAFVNATYENTLKLIEEKKYSEALKEISNSPHFYKETENIIILLKYVNIYIVEDKYSEYGSYKIKQLEFENEVCEDLKDELQIAIEEKEKELQLLEEEKLKEKYGNKLPYDGMKVSELKYTSLGHPSYIEVVDGAFYDGKKYYWYTLYGHLIAECTTTEHSGFNPDEIYNFQFYGEIYGYDENGNFLGDESELMSEEDIKVKLNDKLPQNGLQFKYLKYTSLGVPDGTNTSEDNLTVYYWETEDGTRMTLCTQSRGVVSNFIYVGDKYGYDANGLKLD